LPTRIAVITDAHANLPALDAALAAIWADEAEAVYHTGDAIGIGPFPAEVLDRLLHEPGMRLVMGNHDAWFAFGLPHPRPQWMGEGEIAHQRWVHAQLDPALRPVVAQWPWVIEEEIEGAPVAFLHYALDQTGRGFADPAPIPDPAALDRLFTPRHARLVFYGHQHYPHPVLPEIAGRARYINPRALGCSPEPLARYALLDIDHQGACRLAFRAAPYDPGPLFAAFEEREVPERAFITATFFGG
jgi:predicted phosphodiesterase